MLSTITREAVESYRKMIGKTTSDNVSVPSYCLVDDPQRRILENPETIIDDVKTMPAISMRPSTFVQIPPMTNALRIPSMTNALSLSL